MKAKKGEVKAKVKGRTSQISSIIQLI